MIKNFITTLWGAPNKGVYDEPDPDDLTVDNAYKTYIANTSYTIFS